MIEFNLRKIMNEQKMTLKELSERTNISINTLSLLSTGKSQGIQFKTLNNLVEALGCNIEDLFTHFFEDKDTVIKKINELKEEKMIIENEIQKLTEILEEI
ncbi:helix-turn-helix domain-containing protein [Macrococcoides canis]|uniref:helix-turn-helix domain-containing protein n=1 Tax=Macrococcoides canis TaxID=1855823 RepID=UPI0020B640C8|nr:helix-turn-helix transcriptional regulator [Macrococcus canis]UTG99337.1 helix-turn-helix transcriptional regulator [Macrococcus canis]